MWFFLHRIDVGRQLGVKCLMNTHAMPHEPHLAIAPLLDLMELAEQNAASMTFDIKYASTDNFTGQVIYPQPRAFLMAKAAAALLKTCDDLALQGYGLRVFDAYRPWHVTAYFWDGFPADRLYLANPDEGSRHNRGCAIDLTLYDLNTGVEVAMPSAYDEFNEKAHLSYMGGTAAQNAARQLLSESMQRHGFSTHPHEWWHFDFEGWADYRVLDVAFEHIVMR